MIQNNQLSENQMAESFFSIQDLLKMLAKRKAKNESSERVVRINLSSLHNIHAVSRNRLQRFFLLSNQGAISLQRNLVFLSHD